MRASSKSIACPVAAHFWSEPLRLALKAGRGRWAPGAARGVDPVVEGAAANVGTAILVCLQLPAVEGEGIGGEVTEVGAGKGAGPIGVEATGEVLVTGSAVEDDVGLEDVPGRLALDGEEKVGCKAQDDGKPHEKSNLVFTNVRNLLPPNAMESRVFA